MKFRAKPVEVDAFQYDGDFMNSNGCYYVPRWAVDAFERGVLYFDEINGVPAELLVETPNGAIHIALDDYIVLGEDGIPYPCKPILFEKIFERTED